MTQHCNSYRGKLIIADSMPHAPDFFPLSFLPPSSLPSSPSFSEPRELERCDGPASPPLPLPLPLFNVTISFNQPFSLLRSAASCSNSSTRPDRSETVRSRLSDLSFFLTRKRAEAAVFRLRFSSATASESNCAPSGVSDDENV